MPKIYVDQKGIQMIIPNLLTKSFLMKKGGYMPLEILSCYLHLDSINQAKYSEAAKKKIMVDLCVEIDLFNQSARDAMKYYSKILTLENSHKMHDYYPYSQFLRSFTASLNSIYRLRELTLDIDQILLPNCSYADYHIWNKQHMFDKYISVRNLCMHVETPRVRIERNKVKLIFLKENLEEAFRKTKLEYLNEYLQYEPKSPELIFEFRRPLFGHAVFLAFINSWALKHLKRLKKNNKMHVIVRRNKNGGLKTEEIDLKYLLDHAKGMWRVKI